MWISEQVQIAEKGEHSVSKALSSSVLRETLHLPLITLKNDLSHSCFPLKLVPSLGLYAGAGIYLVRRRPLPIQRHRFEVIAVVDTASGKG